MNKEYYDNMQPFSVGNAVDSKVNDSPQTSNYLFWFDWSDEDKEWVARCNEFPLLSYLDKDKNKAMVGLLRVVADILDELY